MSYILDALKKAEAERETGTVPGLGTAQGSHSTYISYNSNAKPWWIVALVLGVLLLSVLALWVWRQPVVAAPVAPASAPMDLQIAPPQPRLFVPVAEPQQENAAPSRVVVPVVVKSAVPAAPAVPAIPATPIASVAPAVPAATAAASSPAPRAAAQAIPQLSELPQSLRSQIPALNITGAIFSDSPPEWTLIINDQVMGKGSQVAPELRLEEITASSALFSFKGQRFRVDR